MKRLGLLILFLCLMTSFATAQEEGGKPKTKVRIEHYDMITYSRTLGDMQRLIGHVRIRHDSAYFFCDSAYFYEKTNSFDAYQNVHIIVNDSVEVFSDLLNYDGNARFAEFFDNVRLKDDSTLLRTEYLTYDRDQHLACYPDSATTTRGDKMLVSRFGFYRDDLKEFSFFEHVEVTSPKYQMYTDTLFYNTRIEKMWFQGPTTIVNEENILEGERGYYLVDKDFAYFDKHPVMHNKTQRLRSETISYDRNRGFAKALNQVDMIDTSYQVRLQGNYMELWEREEKSFATDSAYATYYDDNDSLYIHGDTLFFHFNKKENELKKLVARRNVRFFKSDMQGKCDTLTYLMSDSVIRMRVNPILWAEDSQLSGDRIDIKVADHKIDSVMQLGNAFIIALDTIEGYNQIKGTNIVSLFKNGNINHVNVNGGNAETIYWIREEDGALIGIDVSKSSTMAIEMKDNSISLIKSFKDISETMYPESELKENDRYLQGFKWHDEARPKDKADIFRIIQVEMPQTSTPNIDGDSSENGEETPKPRHRKKNP